MLLDWNFTVYSLRLENHVDSYSNFRNKREK